MLSVMAYKVIILLIVDNRDNLKMPIIIILLSGYTNFCAADTPNDGEEQSSNVSHDAETGKANLLYILLIRGLRFFF